MLFLSVIVLYLDLTYNVNVYILLSWLFKVYTHYPISPLKFQSANFSLNGLNVTYYISLLKNWLLKLGHHLA